MNDDRIFNDSRTMEYPCEKSQSHSAITHIKTDSRLLNMGANGKTKQKKKQHANINFDDGLGNSFWDATANT